ncbi:MAG: AraC family transcriptional regulator [Clostridia bacterium]|nr:AraC family transcriptional regulator [Clostridia bacterium]
MIFINNHDFTVTQVAYAYYKKVCDQYLKNIKNRPFHGITLIESGELKIELDGKEYCARKGDIILQRKGDSYRLRADEDTEYYVISYLCEPEDDFVSILPSSIIFKPERHYRYADSFKNAANIHFSSGICSVPLLRSVVQEILCNIIRENYPRALSSAKNPVVAAIYYIEEYSNHFLTSEDIASAAGCSQSHLRYLFRKAYGESPMHYLNRVRVERAKEMISTDMFTLNDIASACGFRNVYYFSRVFKEFTGVSPGKY